MSIQSTGASRDPGFAGKPLAVSVKKACHILDVGHTKMWELIRDHRVETVMIGRKRLVIYTSLEALIEHAA